MNPPPEQCVIIDTTAPITELNRLMLSVDNTSLNIEYVLNRIRLCVNDYCDIKQTTSILSDLLWSCTSDPSLHRQLHDEWCKVCIGIYYYLLHLDLQLPLAEFQICGKDIRMISVGG